MKLMACALSVLTVIGIVGASLVFLEVALRAVLWTVLWLVK